MRKTEEIIEILRDELRSGRWKVQSRFPSEEQLMARFGVSRITMNKITEQLVAERFICRGRGGAGSRVISTSPFPHGQIACICGIAHPYYIKMVHGIVQESEHRDYGVNFFAAAANENLSCWLEKIARSNYIGLLSSGFGVIQDSIGLPVVYLDSGFPPDRMPQCSILCDDYAGAARMAEAVIARGHRNILIVTNPSSVEYNRIRRQNGFMDTLRKHGIPDLERRLVSSLSSSYPAAMRRFFLKAYREFPDATMVLTDSDDIALEIAAELRERGCDRQTQVTGFGNLSWVSPLLRIPSVEQHPEEIGATGVSELLHNISHPDAPHCSEILIEPELVNLELIRTVFQS